MHRISNQGPSDLEPSVLWLDQAHRVLLEIETKVISKNAFAATTNNSIYMYLTNQSHT